jgi:hypothetical protein
MTGVMQALHFYMVHMLKKKGSQTGADGGAQANAIKWD